CRGCRSRVTLQRPPDTRASDVRHHWPRVFLSLSPVSCLGSTLSARSAASRLSFLVFDSRRAAPPPAPYPYPLPRSRCSTCCHRSAPPSTNLSEKSPVASRATGQQRYVGALLSGEVPMR